MGRKSLTQEEEKFGAKGAGDKEDARQVGRAEQKR